MNKLTRILIGGDICPVGRNLPLFQSGDASALFNDLLPEFEKSDLSLVNLEAPLIEEATPIEKVGPVLGVPRQCVKGLKAAGVSLVNLANNHILDHGPAGLISTIQTCREAGLAWVGAGENLAAAGEIFVFEMEGIRVGFLAMAENEFTIATRTSPGANPLDPINFRRTIRRQRDSLDSLIVLLHGGVEQYPYPTPRQRDICRFLAEEGADAVICQHSHCPGCYETYHGSHLVYGQGNLIFDRMGMLSSWYEGFLVELSLKKDKAAGMEIIPYRQSGPRPGVRRMAEPEERSFRSKIEGRSRRLGEEGFVEQQWIDYCRIMKNQYLNGAQGYGWLLQRLNNKLRFPGVFRSKKSYRRQLNHIRCESHREALETILRSMT